MALSNQTLLLKNLLGSLEWTDGLKPVLLAQLEQATQQLLIGSPDDDKMRGRVQCLLWLLEGLPRQLEQEETPADEPPVEPAGHPYEEES